MHSSSASSIREISHFSPQCYLACAVPIFLSCHNYQKYTVYASYQQSADAIILGTLVLQFSIVHRPRGVGLRDSPPAAAS